MAQELNLSNLKPASPRRDRKRIGRGMGSGKGRYAGRGIKGQKARSGSHKMRAGFEGGQMPIYMRLGKQRGPYSKDAMPIGPHRTQMAAVNVRDLERFDDEVTPQVLAEAGLIRNAKTEVKVLGHGDLSKKLTVTAHAFSATAREKIEGAGGSVTALKEPKVRRRRKGGKKPKPAPAAQQPETTQEPEPEAEAPAESEES